jgi:hypothetical protein
VTVNDHRLAATRNVQWHHKQMLFPPTINPKKMPRAAAEQKESNAMRTIAQLECVGNRHQPPFSETAEATPRRAQPLVVIPTIDPFDYGIVAPEIVAKLRAQAKRIKNHHSRITTDIIEIGRDLIAAKQYLDHGQFVGWVEAEIGISARAAQAYMSAARLHEKNATVALLPPATVYRLAAKSTPPTVINTVVTRAAAGEIMHDAVVKDMIAEAKQIAKREHAETKLTPRQRKRNEKRRCDREAARLERECDAAAQHEARRRAAALLVEHLPSSVLQDFIACLRTCAWLSPDDIEAAANAAQSEPQDNGLDVPEFLQQAAP